MIDTHAGRNKVPGTAVWRCATHGWTRRRADLHGQSKARKLGGIYIHDCGWGWHRNKSSSDIWESAMRATP